MIGLLPPLVIVGRAVGIALLLVCLGPPIEAGQAREAGAPYDLVLRGGRVIDPETGLDAVRHVGIRGGLIAEITERPLRGDEVVDVGGLVVAPGFIDLHAHGQSNAANEYQAHDGVTTALELESGEEFLREWIASRTGRALINFGASVSHAAARWRAMEAYADEAAEMAQIVRRSGRDSAQLAPLRAAVGPARYEAVAPDRLAQVREELDAGLGAGGLGVGVSVGYYPGASAAEMLDLYAFSAERKAPIFTHVRDVGIGAIQEAISYAAVTGAPLHIVHLNSMALGDIGVGLAMVSAAQDRGLDITTEVYPYTAASTGIASALFDPGWPERMGISFGDLQWEDTGERLTEESFSAFRQEGGTVIIHLMRPEWIDEGVSSPVTLIGSDGMPYAPGAHPRSAGTFARVLGRYVRERGQLSLMDALAKMTIRPAQRLEQRTTYDLEMLQTVGMVKGIENYSRHLSGRAPGEAPPTLLDYFPDDFLLVVDESHQSIPQVGAMYRGDRARKETLVEYGFRLPSALDNRPLKFDEFEQHVNDAIYVSATPADYEMGEDRGCDRRADHPADGAARSGDRGSAGRPPGGRAARGDPGSRGAKRARPGHHADEADGGGSFGVLPGSRHQGFATSTRTSTRSSGPTSSGTCAAAPSTCSWASICSGRASICRRSPSSRSWTRTRRASSGRSGR